LEEFTNYFKSLSVTDENVAREVFTAMDKDGSGDISKEEFAAFGTEFFVGNDPSSPSKLFFGPLPQ
jgi:Ca2+-binding EF-hand superfamily protein